MARLTRRASCEGPGDSSSPGPFDEGPVADELRPYVGNRTSTLGGVKAMYRLVAA